MSQQEQQPEEGGAIVTPVPVAKTRRALSGLKRELTEEDLAAPGTQKMILEEIERLSGENDRMSSIQDDFHRVDKDLAVLREKQKRNISADIVSGSCLAVGAAALGYAPAVWNSPPSGQIALAFGAVLTVAGIIAKAIKL
jgi:hypothetical protein